MILQTGGLAIGLTSTRSRPNSWAFSSAASIARIPSCSPAGPTTRTSRARIRRFVLWSRAIGRLLRKLAPEGCNTPSCLEKRRWKILVYILKSSLDELRPPSLRQRGFLGQQGQEGLQFHGLEVLPA